MIDATIRDAEAKRGGGAAAKARARGAKAAGDLTPEEGKAMKKKRQAMVRSGG